MQAAKATTSSGKHDRSRNPRMPGTDGRVVETFNGTRFARWVACAKDSSQYSCPIMSVASRASIDEKTHRSTGTPWNVGSQRKGDWTAMTSRESVRASMQGNVAQPSKSHMPRTNNKLVFEWKCCTCNRAMLDVGKTNLVVQEQIPASLTLLMPPSPSWCAL